MATTFGLIAVTFLVYDIMVTKRNRKLVVDAARSNAIVSKLFPAGMADKMIQRSSNTPSQKFEAFKNSGPESGEKSSSFVRRADKALADLYLEASVLFADITGFTVSVFVVFPWINRTE